MRVKTLDIALLLVLLVASAVVLALYAILPTPEETAPRPTATPTSTATPTPTLSSLDIDVDLEDYPLPSPTPTATPTSSPTPLPSEPAATPTPRPTAPPGSTATPLPLVARDAPLPSSGLFIRRHNDFAPPSDAGIESLVENGVTVGDTTIAFDRFEPLSGERVPGVEYNGDTVGAMTLRYGLTEIPFSEKRDERATHYLEIALKTRPDDAATAEPAEAPPANYVFVIDTSGSMDGAKINGVKEGMRALFAAMRPQDTLGIVDFDFQARVVLSATTVGELSTAAFNESINRLVAEGGTDVNLGLTTGIQEAARFAGDTTVSHVFLFSDGNPTDGVTEWLEIRRNVVAATHGTQMRVSTFAFGEDANARELDALAGVTGGTHSLVTDPAALGDYLTAELQRRDDLVAKDIQLRVIIDPNITPLYLYGHDQAEEPIARAALTEGPVDAEVATPQPGTEVEEEGLRIFVPDLAAGETYWLVLELAIPADQGDKIGDVEARYTDTVAAQTRTIERDLILSADLWKLSWDVVLQHALSLWTSEVIYYALDDVLLDDLTTAEARLETHLTQMTRMYEDRKVTGLSEQIEALEKLLTVVRSLESGTGAAAAARRELLLYELKAFGRALNGFDQEINGD